MAQMDLTVVGKSVGRIDGMNQVSGRAVFGTDVKLPGMLFGRTLRSPHAHARIRHIDTSRAERLRGVRAVLTCLNVKTPRYGRFLKDQEVFPRTVRYVGDRVAAVAATDPDIADEALELIHVEYEVLPAAFEIADALKPGAAVIHEELSQYKNYKGPYQHPNIAAILHYGKGDIAQGLKEADHVFEERFETHPVHQVYVEPHATVAQADPSGKVTIWSSTQDPFEVQEETAELLGLPEAKVRVIMTAVGGGFGGKGHLIDEPVAALLSQRTGRPVKLVMSREEEFMASQPRHPCVIESKIAVKKDGTLTGRAVRAIFDTGAYGGFTPMPVPGGITRMGGPYRIPHVKIEGWRVYTNKVSFGQYRAPGDPQAAFAMESHMDMVADALGLDPIDFRLKNALQEGDLSPIGEKWDGIGFTETLKRARSLGAWDRRSSRPGHGVGVGCSERSTGSGTSSAVVKLNEDGSLTLLTGAADIGTGAKTILAQITAEIMGVPFEAMDVIAADTEATPYDKGSGASRTTFAAGNAVRLAAEDLRGKVLEYAAERLEAAAEDLVLEKGRVSVKGSPERGVSLHELSHRRFRVEGGPLIGNGTFLENRRNGPNFGTHVAEVEVDPDTGVVRVLSLIAVHDVGRAINPTTTAGQVEGGVAQGIGYAVTEQMVIKDGVVQNPSLMTYLVPTAADLPRIQSVLVEGHLGPGPFGAKGTGEAPTVPTAAAIANAVYNAVGVRIKALPLTNEKVYWALKQLKKQA